MRELLKQMQAQSAQGNSLVLVTVVASSGATPRGAGARMLVGKTGRICGTIGGGAVEYRSEKIAKEVLETKQSTSQDFSLTREDVQNLGMICGGDVHIYFTYLDGSDEVGKLATQALECFTGGKDLWMIQDLRNQGKLSLYTREDGATDPDIPTSLWEKQVRQSARIQGEEGDYFIEKIHSSSRVYIFGGGHVAQKLVPILASVGFSCVVYEDRPEFGDPRLFPEADQVILGDFTRIADQIQVTSQDYVCVMTRGHAYDTQVQAQLLKTPACYIGVIGSAHKKAGVFQKLYEMGFTTEDTDRIVSPIGLSIKAETPAEIAISITAQMIQHRAMQNA